MNSYKDSLQKLFQINLLSGMKFGLQNCERLHAALNFPSNQYKTIHVAGTNGKGSVSTKIAKGLELSHFKTGLFTSPHITTFRERIQINGKLISEKETMTHLNKLFKIRDLNNIPATFFEITTLLALTFFAEQKIDFAVLEAGLGGRLDATNIINPHLTIITSISLDHTDILGDTIEKITLEKAGIIKPAIPVLIGPKVDLKLIEKIAKERKSPLFQVEGSFSSYEEENNALAKRALELLNIKEELIQEALKAKPPCRFQTLFKNNKTIILDVAHNPDGLNFLFKEVRAKYQDHKLRIIFGLSANKDIKECLSILKKEGDYFHIVAAKNGRGLKIEELQKLLNEPEERVFTHDEVGKALESALNQKGGPKEVILICGTFFIMSDALFALSSNAYEPDLIEMNERNVFKS